MEECAAVVREAAPPSPPSPAFSHVVSPPGSDGFVSPNSKIIDKNTGKSYRTGKMLGKGGFATTYQCSCLSTGTEKAVKVVARSTLRDSKSKQKQLYAEIQIHHAVSQGGNSHVNVLNFLDWFGDRDNVYMVVELCHKGTLMDFVKKRKRLTEPETQFYMMQLLDGMVYMHGKNIIHRDLKLGNLFLDQHMNLKIADFGLAVQVRYDGEHKKTICGTPNYIAPEILSGNAGHSFEVDIWAYGVIMYTLLVGKPPFETTDVKLTYRQIKANSYSFPDKIVGRDARDLITRVLHPIPDNRPPLPLIRRHNFFQKGGIPKGVPSSALYSVPRFREDELLKPGEPLPTSHQHSRSSSGANRGTEAYERTATQSGYVESFFDERQGRTDVSQPRRPTVRDGTTQTHDSIAPLLNCQLVPLAHMAMHSLDKFGSSDGASATPPLWGRSPASMIEDRQPIGSSNGDFGLWIVTDAVEDAETQTHISIAPSLLCQLVPCTPSGEVEQHFGNSELLPAPVGADWTLPYWAGVSIQEPQPTGAKGGKQGNGRDKKSKPDKGGPIAQANAFSLLERSDPLPGSRYNVAQAATTPSVVVQAATTPVAGQRSPEHRQFYASIAQYGYSSISPLSAAIGEVGQHVQLDEFSLAGQVLNGSSNVELLFEDFGDPVEFDFPPIRPDRIRTLPSTHIVSPDRSVVRSLQQDFAAAESPVRSDRQCMEDELTTDATQSTRSLFNRRGREPEPDPQTSHTFSSPMFATERSAQRGLVSFSCFAPGAVQNNGNEFNLDISAFVAAQADAVVQAARERGKVEAGSRKTMSLTVGVDVTVTLKLPAEAFEVDDAVDSFEWDGSKGHAQFAVRCLRKAEPRIHTCIAFIDVNGERKGRLIFDLKVCAADEPSPPVSPPSERECELQLLEFALSAGKQYHFFICHHQGSGGDQSNLLCLELRQLGYIVWYDNGVMATERNLPGMKDGVAKSECLLIFLSGRKESMQAGESVADTNGEYEGTFTRWFCHEEMVTARQKKLRFVGVMETELRHCKPDFALEKSRARTGGKDGGPVHGEHVEGNLQLMDDLCFIPFRRQAHEVPAMLKEIIRQAMLPNGGIGQEISL